MFLMLIVRMPYGENHQNHVINIIMPNQFNLLNKQCNTHFEWKLHIQIKETKDILFRYELMKATHRLRIHPTKIHKKLRRLSAATKRAMK